MSIGVIKLEIGSVNNNNYNNNIQPSKPLENRTSMDAQNLDLHLPNGFNLNVPYMQADFIDLTPKDPMDITSIDSYKVKLDKGAVNFSDVDVSVMVNQSMKESSPNSPVQDLRFVFKQDNKVSVEGKIKKSFLNIPLKVEGKIESAGDKYAIFTPEQIKIWNIPLKGVMDLFGIKVSTFASGLSDSQGRFFCSGNTFFLNPAKFVPTAVSSKMSSISTFGGGRISVAFGDQPTSVNPKGNYVHINGGNLTFNGALMKNADVDLKDTTPNTPLDLMNEKERMPMINKGDVVVSKAMLTNMIVGGNTGLKDGKVSLDTGVPVVSGKMGILPIKFNLVFGKTEDGKLAVTPEKGKILGFIPIPSGILADKIQKSSEGSVVQDKSVVLDLMKSSNMGLAPLKEVQNTTEGVVLRM